MSKARARTQENGSARVCWRGTRQNARASHILVRARCWLAAAEIKRSGSGRVSDRASFLLMLFAD